MATGYKGDVDEKQAADDRYNPSGAARDLYNRETDDSVFDDIADNYDKTADDNQENANINKAKNRDDVKEKEDNAGNWNTNYSGGNKKTPLDLLTIAKKKGPLAAIIAVLGGGGILLGGFGAPAMLLMQITDIFTNNFNDAHTALTVRTNVNIGQKIKSTRNSFSETSSGKCGIVCKHTTMSDTMARNLEARGFKISPEAGTGKFNRRIVQSITFPDGTTANNGDEFKKALKDPARAVSFNRVFNSKTRYFLNSKFGSMLKSKLGINKAYKLAGESKEKFKESFRKSLGLPEKAATIEPNLSPEEKIKANPRLAKTALAIGKLGGKPTNAIAGACFAYNTTRAITASLKIAKYTAYASFAMTFFNAAHKLKAADGGGIDPLVVSELGDMLTYTDANQTNADGTPNDKYGLSATDSYGYKAAAYGDTGTAPAYAQSNSMESSGVLGVLAGLAFFTSGTPESRAVASTTCRAASGPLAVAVQCAPALAGTPIAALICVVSNLAIGLVIGEVIAAIMPYVIDAVVKANVAPLDENTKGVLAGDALYPGAAAILGGHASSYGMKTGTKEEIKNYIALGNEVREQDIAIAKIEAKENPLDISNQYSFLGSIARNLNIASYANSNLTSSASLIASTIPRSLATLTTSTHAGTYMPVAENKANQYSVSDACPALKSIGTAGDAYCMPAYTKSATELNADIEANLNYMYTHNYIDGDTGAPRTDTPEGKTFQKYLDNCVFRIDAMGETSQSLESGDDGDIEWFLGTRCNEDSEMVTNFRIYAMDEPVNADFDGEESVLKSSTAPTAGSQTGNGAGENSGNVSKDGWSFPTTAGAPLTQGYHEGHLALDIGSDPNATSVPIYAMRDGVVLSVGDMPAPYVKACESPTGTIQQAVTIEHNVNGKKYISAYHHVEAGQFPFKVGDTVKAGDRIATMGNTGCSFGRHLHVELWIDQIYGGGTTVDLGAILYG
jgi:hypothetical protein